MVMYKVEVDSKDYTEHFSSKKFSSILDAFICLNGDGLLTQSKFVHKRVFKYVSRDKKAIVFNLYDIDNNFLGTGKVIEV
jgi:hypothetical protein